MASVGLRARRKQENRELIAATAARLFAERGYENVAVIDVARAAEVSEQTVYNHFPSKEHLVLDRDDELRARLVDRIRTRPPGSSPASAIRPDALAWVDAMAAMSRQEIRGGLGYLAVNSPAVRRLSLGMTDRHAEALAAALTDTFPEPAVAKRPSRTPAMRRYDRSPRRQRGEMTMGEVAGRRMMAEIEGDFVVFLIGAR